MANRLRVLMGRANGSPKRRCEDSIKMDLREEPRPDPILPETFLG